MTRNTSSIPSPVADEISWQQSQPVSWPQNPLFLFGSDVARLVGLCAPQAEDVVEVWCESFRFEDANERGCCGCGKEGELVGGDAAVSEAGEARCSAM